MTAAVMQAKPKKPYPQFPLTVGLSGQWRKKIGGKVHYFGKWSDPDAALAEYRRQFPYLQVGLEAPVDAMTLAMLLNHFDDHKKAQLQSGRINERSYGEYMKIATVVADVLGKSRPVATIMPHDLAKVNHRLALTKNGQPASPVVHKRQLTFARMIFHYGNEFHDLNVKYKQALKSPEKRLIRQRRAAVGEKMFTASQIRAMLKQADPIMKVVILLGINAGYGPNDCIELTSDRIRDGFIDFVRPKTGVQRRCPLWKETQKAIAAIADDERVLTGPRWNRHMLARSFRALATVCGFYRKGVSIYSLRRTFETIGKNSGANQSAIDRVMGHERPEMSETYNQRTFDKQLIMVTSFVEKWLNGKVKL